MKVHFKRCHKAVGQQPELLYLNHQAAPLLKVNKDIFSNESGAVGGNSVSNNSFLSPFYKFPEKPEDPFEFVNEIYLKAVRVKEMQRKVEEIHRVFHENCSHSTESPTNSDFLANSKSHVCHPFRFQHSVSICHPRHLLPLIPKKLKKKR
jgi:hypothetical protein